jgi:hypothetical protein
MNALTPWTDPTWKARARLRVDEALDAVGRPRVGPAKARVLTGRSWIETLPTEAGILWIKHGYRLPPGEEQILEILTPRWPQQLPKVVTTWEGGVAMKALPGVVLPEDATAEVWASAATGLAELSVVESAHVPEWLEVGVRDRRPDMWQAAVLSLLQSQIIADLDDTVRLEFESFVPEFISRYVDAFQGPPTLVHQDSGCCNIHITDAEPVFFDWADVIIGSPVFSCDRLLDKVPAPYQEAVIKAFLAPLNMEREDFNAMRRSNVLHEILRYHDELAFLIPGNETHTILAGAVKSQIENLTTFESGRR